MRKIITAAVLCLVAGWTTLGTAQAQTQLGWVHTLAGSCWQGTGASGTQLERQCFQLQFGRFLRAQVSRPNGYSGDSVLGYSSTRHRLEMYNWNRDDAPSILTPSYDGTSLTFAEQNGRVVWRAVDGDTFQIARQTRSNATWTDGAVITFRRDGVAPTVFSARSGNSIDHPAGGFRWVDSLAGHCFHQSLPHDVAANRGCFSWQYPHILRQTWYWGVRPPSGESVYFLDGRLIRSFSWDAQGNFGLGQSQWIGDVLYSIYDAAPRRRTVLRRVASGFSTATETNQSNNDNWSVDHTTLMRLDD